MPRIAPLSPPYTPAVEEMLRKWMPPGAAVEPLKLFRTLVVHAPLAERMRPLGAALLRGSLPLRARELVILRACARCQAEYEWGVHVSAFAAAAGLDEDAVAATRRPDAAEHLPPGDGDLVRLVDELHDTGTVSETTWQRLAAAWPVEQLLELVVLTGFYHLISFVANAAAVEPEPWAARFRHA
jgi:alkylhydroperoxidase family enzyme